MMDILLTYVAAHALMFQIAGVVLVVPSVLFWMAFPVAQADPSVPRNAFGLFGACLRQYGALRTLAMYAPAFIGAVLFFLPSLARYA